MVDNRNYNTRGKTKRTMTVVLGLPPHIVANILRRLPLHDTMRVAHTCRAYHAYFFVTPTCHCAQAAAADADTCARMRASAVWSHWRPCKARRGSQLTRCAKYGHVACVAVLVGALDCDPSYNGHSSLRSACARGHVGIVDVLLRDARTDPTEWNYAAIRCALTHNHDDVLHRLLDDPRAHGFRLSPCDLGKAVRGDRWDVVTRVLRQASAVRAQAPHIRYNFDMWLSDAVFANRADRVRRILQEPLAHPIASAAVCLLQAIMKRNLDMVDAFLSDERLDLRDAVSALSTACSRGPVAMVDRILVDARFDPHSGDHSALSQSIDRVSVDIVERLLEHPHCSSNACVREAMRMARQAGRNDVVELCCARLGAA